MNVSARSRGVTLLAVAQARKAIIPVAIDAEGIAGYSQDLEAAVYFSVLEALQNVQKSGLTNLTDRVHPLGDAVYVHSERGRGTTLVGNLAVPVRLALPV